MVFFEKACGVKFLKHGGAVNLSKVVDPLAPLVAFLCMMAHTGKNFQAFLCFSVF